MRIGKIINNEVYWMSVYKFLDSKEKMIKINLKSFKDAKEYAEKNNLVSLTMDYKDFIKAFDNKVNKLKEHTKYNELLKQAEQAKTNNIMSGYDSIVANDFIKRIITLPLEYIKGWLDGKNNLKWLPEYK
jgi:hypothetical protein